MSLGVQDLRLDYQAGPCLEQVLLYVLLEVGHLTVKHKAINNLVDLVHTPNFEGFALCLVVPPSTEKGGVN